MAKTGRTYHGRRSPSHMMSEARRLRQENRHLKATLRKIRDKMDSGGSAKGIWRDKCLRRKVKETVNRALDGGGDAS